MKADPEPQRIANQIHPRAVSANPSVRVIVTYRIEARVVELNTGLNFLDCYLFTSLRQPGLVVSKGLGIQERGSSSLG